MNYASWMIVCLSSSLLLSSCARQEKFEDSGVAAALLPDTTFVAAAQGRGIHVDNGGAGFVGGVYRVELQKEATVEVDNGSEADFMSALKLEVERLVVTKGGTIEGRGDDRSRRELTRFQVDYRWAKNQGIIRVHSSRESNRIRIQLFCYEHLRGITPPSEKRTGRWSWVWKLTDRP